LHQKEQRIGGAGMLPLTAVALAQSFMLGVIGDDE
jgi:hypothetical protein